MLYQNTYCNVTDENVRRYKREGYTRIKHLDKGDEFLVACILLGREVCYKANKDYNYLKRIIKLMNIDLRSLISYFSILEAIGLLKTYYNKNQDSYVFALVAPEKAHLFFQNPLLVTKLLDCLKIHPLL